MPFYSIHVKPDVGNALSETFAGSTEQLKLFVADHHGIFRGAVSGEDADDDGHVFAELPEDAIPLLREASFFESVGEPIMRTQVVAYGNIQDGDSDYTSPLEPAAVYN